MRIKNSVAVDVLVPFCITLVAVGLMFVNAEWVREPTLWSYIQIFLFPFLPLLICSYLIWDGMKHDVPRRTKPGEQGMLYLMWGFVIILFAVYFYFAFTLEVIHK